MLDNIYKDEDQFSGTSENFKLKVAILYNKYRQVRLLVDTNIYDISIMLSS